MNCFIYSKVLYRKLTIFFFASYLLFFFFSKFPNDIGKSLNLIFWDINRVANPQYQLFALMGGVQWHAVKFNWKILEEWKRYGPSPIFIYSDFI